MRSGWKASPLAALAAPLVLAALAGTTALHADEPSRLGRLFRFGSGSGSENPVRVEPPPRSRPAPVTAPGVVPEAPPSTPIGPAGAPAPAPVAGARLVPQPRVSRAVTESDPIVTRVTLGRSNEGQPFGMLLQIFADGTVIDSEGVHQLGKEGIKGVLAALEASELYRLRGHCGGPPTDFIEQVHIVVFERSLGRLRANAFSFSGNSQGCDHSVRVLQNAIDGLQARLGPPGSMPATAGTAIPPVETRTFPSPFLASGPVPGPMPPSSPGIPLVGPNAPELTPSLPASAAPTIRLNEEPTGR